MTEMKPMTAEDLIEKLKRVDPKLPVYIFSPEGFMMSCDFVVKEYYINWTGKLVYIAGKTWHSKPDQD